MTSIRFTQTALAIAVAATLTSGVAAAAEQQMPSVNNNVLTGQAGDTLKTVSNKKYENKGTIKDFGTIHLASWSTLTNSGNIENIGSFTGESDASRLVNKASGTIHVNSNAFDVSLQNEGNVIVHGDSLSFVDRDLVVKTGSTIVGTDGKRLKKISLRNEAGERTAAAVEVEEGAVLEADVIEADSGRIGSVVKGKITGDVVNLQGSFINLYATAEIIGRDVTLTQIDQANNDTENEFDGGRITATEKLTLTSFSRYENTLISAPVIRAATYALTLLGETQFKDVERLELGSTMSVCDKATINGDNSIKEVVFIETTGAYGPRIQQMQDSTIHIGTLTVNKSVTTDGTLTTSNLVDGSKPAEDGRVAFVVDNVNIADGAALTVYADDSKAEAKTTSVELGNVEIGKDGELQLGWRDGGYLASGEKTIERLVLKEGASVSVDPNATRAEGKAVEAQIASISFEGSGASVATTIKGSSTDVTIKEGVTGSTLADVQSEKLGVTIEKVSETSQISATVGEKTAVTVTGAAANNTGSAVDDLEAVAQSIAVTTKNEKDETVEKTITVTQEADEIHDGATGSVTFDETGKSDVTGVKTSVNVNTHGIAEMTVLGLQIWRNEINDMNKRLGELRDSSAEENGVWARVYNGKASGGSLNIENKYTAFQFGYDRQVVPGTWIGGALSWTDGSSDFSAGGGDNSVLALTGYGSKLWDNGLFLDVTAKYGRIKNEFDIVSNVGRTTADYDTNAFSMSAEAGWRLYPLHNAFFVEPQVEVMYGHVESVDYTTSTGVKVEQDAADTLIGRAGVVLGVKCPNDRGNAYVRASVLHDWKGETEYRFGKDGAMRTISGDLGDTWTEFGIGANFNATKQVHVYADVEATSGAEIDTDYRVNLGVRYAF